ncbi:MAG: glutamate mutase L [Anaerolineae bacterium]|nr:glutamate mutase L [Anaerolineae bacterium]
MAHDIRMPTESILAIDCGSTTTQVALFGQVAGEFRFIARGQALTTVEPPWNDLMASVRQAIRHLSDVTGWSFLDDRGQLITPERQNGGVDLVVATTSASEPLRLVLTGIMRDVSLASARRAIGMSNAVVSGLVSVDRRDGGTLYSDIGGQVRLINELMPDAVVIVGGVDGGAARTVLQSVEAVALACSALPESSRPPLIYAGNTALREAVAEIVGNQADLRAVDNVRPSLDVENLWPLQAEIDDLYRLRKMDRLPGFGALAAWTPLQVLPTPTAFAHTIQYLARLDGINVLGVDVGGANTTVASVVDDQADLLVRTDLGLSYSAPAILDHVPVESILRWLPFEMDPVDLSNALYNKAVHNRTLPQTRQDLLLEQATAREVIRLSLAEVAAHWPRSASVITHDLTPLFHLIVGAGGVLSNVPNYGQAALILLDAVQPVGVFSLALDKARLVASVGAVAAANPLAASQVVARDALLNLGTVVAPVGSAREGETALSFKIEYQDGRSLQVEVAYGSLEVIPLPSGQIANLELRPTRRFDVGLGVKGQPGKTQVQGGILGIIIDARGRPLPIAADPEQQRERIQRWLWDMGS